MKFTSVLFSCLLVTILFSGSLCHPIIGIPSDLIGKLAVPILSVGGSLLTAKVINDLYHGPGLGLTLHAEHPVAIGHHSPLLLSGGLGGLGAHGLSLH